MIMSGMGRKGDMYGGATEIRQSNEGFGSAINDVECM
jgi:hypothetical protein